MLTKRLRGTLRATPGACSAALPLPLLCPCLLLRRFAQFNGRDPHLLRPGGIPPSRGAVSHQAARHLALFLGTERHLAPLHELDQVNP